MNKRQLLNNLARPKPTTTSTSTGPPHCTPFTLPSNGVISFGDTEVLTLTTDVVFEPECTGTVSDIIVANGGSSPSSLSDFRDPFYASTIPECYALASATVIAYMLVIMLVITPRTFVRDGAILLGRRSFTNGPSGSDAGIGIGGRPWLQKVAALTVAISLTIATADTFRVAAYQYEAGIMDALALQNEVEDGTELQVIRVISDTFLWLAQAQTLIRLFPRQREKIIIKWTAFGLISLDVLFSILNNWVYQGPSRPRTFVDAVPALAYLFQLALSLLYSAWVMYYSITKRRYAFYHPQMKNICVVALLSLLAILVPTVFFVLDISKPNLAGWGDYVRWVGAAAASVAVWEWVERIETLERNDKKDGVLGREVFDGDEMIDVTPSSDTPLAAARRGSKDDDNGGGGRVLTTGANGRPWPGMARLASRYRKHSDASHDVEIGRSDRPRNTARQLPRPRPPLWPTRPPLAATPVSRTDTASAESTVYAIRYHPIGEATPPARAAVSRSNSLEHGNENSIESEEARRSVTAEQMQEGVEDQAEVHHGTTWQAFSKANPFRRKTEAPPAEVSAQQTVEQTRSGSHVSTNWWDIRTRLEDFAANQAEKRHEKSQPSAPAAPLPVTIIPAPPRRRNLQGTLEELEDADRAPPPDPMTLRSLPSRTYPTSRETDVSALSLSHRLSDPYTPSQHNQHTVLQRGSLTFLTGTQQDKDRVPWMQGEHVPAVSTMTPVGEDQDREATASSPSSNTRARTPTSPVGLPIRTFPAPPRRARVNDDE